MEIFEFKRFKKIFMSFKKFGKNFDKYFSKILYEKTEKRI